MTKTVFDDVIVGAGSSGAVLAARLSADPDRRVLLLEAGPDYPSLAETPADIRGPDVSLHAHDWRLRSVTIGTDKTHAFPRGRVVGGSSAVNGAVALRGVPADYDEWVACGNRGWGWEQVLPYFRRLEDDELGPSSLHGRGGPIPVRRTRVHHFCETQAAAHESFRALGFGEVSDHNDPTSTGVGPIPLNLLDGVRISTALGYLAPARNRKNLTVRGNVLVHRICIQNERAIGVECAIDGRTRIIGARRIAVCAGAIHTPAILMRSGVGARADVERLGIDCLVDLPGVGARLVDHPAVGMYAVPRAGAQRDDEPNHQTMVRYTAAGSDQFNDMQLFLFGRVPLKGTPLAQLVGAERPFLAVASLVKPRAVGRVVVTSADPHVAPRIELDFHSDAEDTRRLVHGLRLCWDALRADAMAARIDRIPNWPEPVLRASDEALARAMAPSVGTSYHPAGTARMGPSSDPASVVDSHCRVHGIANLRVVDASVMPTVPRANTNLTCIMLGERVSDFMLA